MAKIVFTYDSKEEVASVTVDGETIENVVYFNASPSYDEGEWYVCIEIAKQDQNGMKQHIRMVTAESKEGAKLITEGHSLDKTKEFVEVPCKPKVLEDISKFLSTKQ